jgi:hypothetical protein
MTPTVACVLRTGQRVTDMQPYRVEHVTKLRKGVSTHLPTPHRFVCLTDIPGDVTAAGVEAITLPAPWAGWWSKINLFAPNLLIGPVLYLDLDSLVTGDLTPLVRTSEGITMVADFYSPHMMNSSAMAWNGDFSAIWHAFSRDSATLSRAWDRQPGARVGDQGFIHDTLRAAGQHIDTFDPSHVVSLKQKARHAAPPNARVISCHGTPKPDSPQAGWAFTAWSAL